MKTIIKKIFTNIIYLLDLITPKNKSIIVFFQSNNRFNDNAKILFEYMLKNTNYQVYWLYENIKHKEANFIKRYSLQGLILFLKSKYCFNTHGLGDFGIYRKNIKKTIQLWHGTPIKMIGQYDKKIHYKELVRIKKESECYDLFIVGSEIEQHFISSSMFLKKNICLISGLPRNDYLLSGSHKRNDFLDSFKNKKIILYAPTFRDFKETKLFPFKDFDIINITEFLIEKNSTLLVRPHPSDKDNFELVKKLSIESKGLLQLASNEEVQDTNDLLPFVDVVITDYSSIYIDLLLKDIPPIFIPYDLEDYEKVRGLAYDYELVTPGPKVFTQKEFEGAIDDALNGAEQYKEQRKFVKRMFHKYDDGQACKRIIEAMEKLV